MIKVNFTNYWSEMEKRWKHIPLLTVIINTDKDYGRTGLEMCVFGFEVKVYHTTKKGQKEYRRRMRALKKEIDSMFNKAKPAKKTRKTK